MDLFVIPTIGFGLVYSSSSGGLLQRHGRIEGKPMLVDSTISTSGSNLQ
jgi:hypothetical protein